jgi:methylenetetrahydrofolate reductase (NADPH)
LKGKDIRSIYAGIDPLLEFKPSFINVTYHREEVIYKERGHGLLQKIRLRKRPGTVGICAMIKAKYNIDTVPHLICGGFSKEDTEDALIELNFLGIDNVLALRGDAVKNEGPFIPERDGHAHAEDLIRQIDGLNKGKYLYEEEEEADEEAPDQAGPLGDRHGGDVGERDAGLIERLLHHPGDGQRMAA